MRIRDLRETHAEDRCKYKFLALRHLQAPENWHRKDDGHDINEEIQNAEVERQCLEIAAMAPGDVWIPTCRHWTTDETSPEGRSQQKDEIQCADPIADPTKGRQGEQSDVEVDH